MNCCKKTKRNDEEKKQLLSRINRISGQINGIKKMIEDDTYCNDVLMFENHVYRCISNDIEKGNTEVIDELTSLFKRFND